MFRSLHMKLCMIMILLVVAVVAVIGTFLLNSVSGFYITEFYDQMSGKFSEDAEFVANLRRAASDDDAVTQLTEVLKAYSADLGVDGRYRNYYILDGDDGRMLASSSDASSVSVTPNILTAINGEVGSYSFISNPYMDVAVPISADGERYIVYIMDTKENQQSLTDEMFLIIMEAMIFALLITVLLSMLLSKTMTNPIEELTRGVSHIASGEFEDELPVQSKDEIGTLTDSFNDMARILKNMLESIGSEKDKLNTLFLHMTDGVVAFSYNGNIMHINPAAMNMLEIDETSDYNTIFSKTVPMEEVLQLTSPQFLETDFAVGEKQLKLNFAPFALEGGEHGVMTVVHDVTEQQKLESTRREFVANVSHELRTPLTNIKSYTETIIESGDSLPAEMRTNFLNVVLSETDRMSRIVGDLLTLSKFDYRKMDWNLSVFKTATVVDKVYQAMLMEAQKHGHDMTLNLQENLPEIKGDFERLEQVIINIISNSIKYTPDGGKIEITASGDEKTVVIRVKDNGMGVPSEDVSKLFDRFYRVDKARSREKGGTGLGLSIAREIVQHHGGDIYITSDLGKGMTVDIMIPAYKGE